MAFPNKAEVNYHAIRDMGLAAWWGSSLGSLAGLVRASNTLPTPKERFQVLDEGWKASRGFQTAAITSYVIGTQLVRFDGNFFGSRGPKWLEAGPENGLRTALTFVAITAAVAAKGQRARAGKELKVSGGRGTEKFDKLLKREHLLHAVTPAATGWLLYSHLKDSMGV